MQHEKEKPPANKGRERLFPSPTLLSVLLAASAQSRCTALVCSCYAPSRNSGNTIQDNKKKKQSGAEGEVDNHELQGQGDSTGSCGSDGPLKSNLKKTTLVLGENQLRTAKRKVTWPDSQGKDIAHVQEFEPSVLEDGELEGVRNSCICAIQ
ncbi:uncharacterized protein LOC117915184 [Vitis riparia]|uniref:uncharacterized protein LOC117915184 n=1 Tax=Vitis riparia TaxID=96939 RepID=UPI00155ACF03|nr:uncharacterized protein LOC117915184 [Vitis riparia]